MRCIKDINYAESTNTRQTLDLFLPEYSSFPAFVYFHGGGLTGGCKEDNKFIGSVVKRGVCVVSANYRLYPDAKFPEYVEDAAAVVAWIKSNISKYGNCTHIFVGGSSAGGYLTELLCFDKHYLQKYEIDADSIDGYFMDAGQPTSHFNVISIEKGLDSRRIIVDETAPLFFVESGRQYPPMKILVSDNDIPCRLEQTKLLVSTLKHFGYDMSRIDFKVVKNSRHCEYLGKEIFADYIYEFIMKNVR